MVNKHNFSKAFSIVEILVVIVVIGILAAIVMVSYNGIQAKAYDVSVLSDIDKLDALETNYSLKNNMIGKSYYSTESSNDSDLEFSPSSNNVINVAADSLGYCIRGYNLKGTKNSMTNAFTKESDSGVCSRISPYKTLYCPAGFIVVPGSLTYGTDWFCVMKYEAKVDSNGDGNGDTTYTTGYNTWPNDTYPVGNGGRMLVSSASGYPLANISQTTAITDSASYTENCSTGCHLITEAEWMTIAQNVLSVPSNWSGGSVGNGFIYSGHNDNVPANALVADVNDSNSYVGTGNFSGDTSTTSGMVGNSQRRTLTLTNGEVIWDLAGNVHEWTNATIAGGQQPGLSGESAYAIKEWNNSSLLMNGLPILSQPSSTGISGITDWSSIQGIGQLSSNYGESAARAFRRGGLWSGRSFAGVLDLRLNLSSDDMTAGIGLRISQ